MDRRNAIQRVLGMTGLAVSSPLYLSVMQGCTPSGSSDWSSAVFDTDQSKTLVSITEVMLPREGMPSASDVHAAECVDLLLKDCHAEKEVQEIRGALDEFNQRAQSEGKNSFANLSEQNQLAFLQDFEKEMYRTDSVTSSGYKSLKGLILMAYFTSEEVMKNHLNYNPIPGRHQGCIDLPQDGKVFVDNNV